MMYRQAIRAGLIAYYVPSQVSVCPSKELRVACPMDWVRLLKVQLRADVRAG